MGPYVETTEAVGVQLLPQQGGQIDAECVLKRTAAQSLHPMEHSEETAEIDEVLATSWGSLIR